MADEDEEYDAFVKIHRVQLEISRLPVHHWRPLYEKLKNEVNTPFYIGKSLFRLKKARIQSSATVRIFHQTTCKCLC